MKTKQYFDDLLDQSISIWLKEDIGDGDHTTFSTIPESTQGKATLIAKEEGIIAGIFATKKILNHFDHQLNEKIILPDGSVIRPGDQIMEISGKVRSILQTERLILNVLQRLSGIATQTHNYVQLLEGYKTRILDTRKTTPGFRMLEKEAVRLGGAINHRFGLFDMILIKDNHIDFAGGIAQAIHSARKYLQHYNKKMEIEVEARTLDDVKIILEVGDVDRILLDNFSPEQTKEAVKLINGAVITESSGGLTKDMIIEYAKCGVDYISVGALTHHIKSLDLSLKAL